LFEVKGLEKTSLTRREIEQAIIVIRNLAENAGYRIPEYMLVLFLDEKEYDNMLKYKDLREVEEGILVSNGDFVAIKSVYLPVKLLEKVFIGILTVFHYNTFLVYDINVAKEFLKEKYLYFLSLVYKET